MAEFQTSEIWRVQILDVLFMRGADVGRSPRERRPGVGRVSTDWLITDRNSEGARPYIDRAFHSNPVSLLTGAGRFLITSFRRAPPEPRPKCDRVHFKPKYTLDSLANLKFGAVRAIYNFGRRSLDMWRKH